MMQDIYWHAGIYTLAIVFAIMAGAARISETRDPWAAPFMLAMAVVAILAGMIAR